MKKIPVVHILNITESATRRLRLLSRRAGVGLLAAMLLLPNISFAVDTVCAKVKIEITQELTMLSVNSLTFDPL
jgi:hypothetical protein